MERILQENGKLNEWSAVKSIAGQMRNSSGAAFARGDDQEAKLLRDLATMYETHATGLRARFEEMKKDAPTWEQLSDLLIKQGGWDE